MSAAVGTPASALPERTRTGRRPGVGTVFRWEIRKHAAVKRTYLGLAAVVAVPLIFIGALASQPGAPEGVPLGNVVRDSALAIPLVLLLFGSIWLFPLAAALVAGDIFAAEDGNGTLKTILTRSVSRAQVFWGKLAAAALYAVLALLAMAVTALAAGYPLSGFNPLPSLSGTQISTAHAFVLVGASLLVYLMPLLAIVAVGVLLSVTTRNSAAAVVGTLIASIMLQLIGILPGTDPIRPYLLTTQFQAWLGLVREPTDWEPIVRAAWVSAAHAVPAVAAALWVFMRRDVAGG